MKCCVASCKQSSESLLSETQEVIFYEFPTIPWLRKSWLVSIGMKESHLPPDAAVCSLHFQKDNFIMTTRGDVRLRRNSVPSVFKIKNKTDSPATSPLSSSPGQFCMICLDADCKLYPLGKYLAKAYSNVTGISKNLIFDKNGASKLCSECAQRLINCHKFKDKTLKTYNLLLLLYEKHGTLTLEKVKTINRVGHQLTSNIVKHIIEPDHCDLHLKEDLEEERNVQEENSTENTEIKTEIDDDSLLDSEVNSETSDCKIVSEKDFLKDLDDIYNDVQVTNNQINNDELIESDLEYTYDDRLNDDDDNNDIYLDDDNLDFTTVSHDSDNEAEFLNYDDVNEEGYSDVECLEEDIDHIVQNLYQSTNNAEEKKINKNVLNIEKNAEQNADKTMSKSPDKTVIKQLIVCCEDIIKLRSKTDVQTKPKPRENSKQNYGYEMRTPRSRKNSKDEFNNHTQLNDNDDFTDENSYTDLECLDEEIDDDINKYINHGSKLLNEYESYVKFVNENIRKEGDTISMIDEVTSNIGNENKHHSDTKKKVTLDNLVLVRATTNFDENVKLNSDLKHNETVKHKMKHENQNNNLGISPTKPTRTGYRSKYYGTKNKVKLKNAIKDRKASLKSKTPKKSNKSLAKRKNSTKEAKLEPHDKTVSKPKKDKDDWKNIKVVRLSREEQFAEIEKRKETDNYKKSPYQCNICYKGFLDNKTFTEHMERHTDKFGLFECAICHVHSKTERALKSHFLLIHTARYSCTKCPFVSNIRQSARMHEQWHEGRKFECTYCGEEFTRQSTHMLHVRVKHPSDFVCTLCGFSFIGERGLRMHMNIKHPGAKTQDLDGPTCEVCDIRFASVTAYEQHMKVSPKHAAADKRKRNFAPKYEHYKWPNRRQATRRSTLGEAECEQCGVVLEGARSYFLHFRKHHPDKNRTKYPHGNAMCEQCGKVFRSLTHLRLHMPYHAEQKQFKCDVCDKRFALKNNLAVHTAAVHMQQRYECEVCGKFLSNKSNLWKHMLMHQEPRPLYACVVCNKSFTSPDGRHEHVKHVHGNVPYKRRVRGPRANRHKRAERDHPDTAEE